MKIDANDLSHNQEIYSDVCIIGGGPAGMNTSNEFLASDIKVTVLESGGHKYINPVQMLTQGNLSGEIFLDQTLTHIRQIGGTANSWILQMTDAE